MVVIAFTKSEIRISIGHSEGVQKRWAGQVIHDRDAASQIHVATVSTCRCLLPKFSAHSNIIVVRLAGWFFIWPRPAAQRLP